MTESQRVIPRHAEAGASRCRTCLSAAMSYLGATVLIGVFFVGCHSVSGMGITCTHGSPNSTHFDLAAPYPSGAGPQSPAAAINQFANSPGSDLPSWSPEWIATPALTYVHHSGGRIDVIAYLTQHGGGWAIKGLVACSR